MLRFCKVCGSRLESNIIGEVCNKCDVLSSDQLVLGRGSGLIIDYTMAIHKSKNISAFLDRQNRILTKYEDVTALVPGTEDMTMRDFSRILDQYLLQAAEELSETYDEIEIFRKSNGQNKQELLMEIIDVAMYVGTIICLLDNAIGNLSESYKSYDEIYTTVNRPFDIDQLEKEINKITYDLIDIRRLNPERKWHKPYKEITGFEVVERLMTLRSRFLNSLSSIITTLNMFETDGIDVNKNICSKQDFIIGLPVITKR